MNDIVKSESHSKSEINQTQIKGKSHEKPICPKNEAANAVLTQGNSSSNRLIATRMTSLRMYPLMWSLNMRISAYFFSFMTAVLK